MKTALYYFVSLANFLKGLVSIKEDRFANNYPATRSDFESSVPSNYTCSGNNKQCRLLVWNSLIKRSLFSSLLFFFSCVLANAQSFPVQIVPQATPPPPIYFSEYADAGTVNSPLKVQLILNDFQIANREVRLKTYFEGNGITFRSNDMVVGARPLFLEGGVPLVLTNTDLAAYFKFENITGISPNVYGSAIPEGVYQFCFEVYDMLTGNRLSQKSCAVSVIFQNDPPFLISPGNRTNVAETNPQNIIFQWTPRSINVTSVEYELTLVEIWDNVIDPQAAFFSSPPVFQTTTTGTTYVYGPSDPLLLSGKRYAWRVRAMAKQGAEEIGLFKNQGQSEIFSFSYAGNCEQPLGLNHEVKGSTNANIFWEDLSTDVPEYTVRYRQKGHSNVWFFSKTTTNQLTLWDLKAGTTYEYQLQKKCAVTGSDWSMAKQFTTFIVDNQTSLYECGIIPNLSLDNKEPLPNITSGEQFTAGDFPITLTEVNGGNGRFSGKGYVTIPYLNSIKVAVEFTNVLINTDNQLAEGMVVTKYDADMKNILDVDVAIDIVSAAYDAVTDLGESTADILKDVFNRDDEQEENAPEPEPISDVTEIPTNNESSSYVDNNLVESNNDTASHTSESPQTDNNTLNESNLNTGPHAEDTSNTEKEAVIVFNGTEYSNNEVIEVIYDKTNSHYAFLLKNHPEDATLKWQILKSGTDYTPEYITNEPIYDNLGIDMKKVYVLDLVANYNDKRIKVTLHRKLKDFDLINIYAKPEDSPSRIAKSGQKLYLKKSSTSINKAKRKVDFSVHVSPNLSQGDISHNGIRWYYEMPDTQYNLGKNYGRKNIHLNLTEQNTTYSVKVEAGNPNKLNKNIDVVWFDGTETSWSNMPPVVREVLNKSLEDINEGVESLNNILPSDQVTIKLDEIKVEGSEVKKEDNASRLYYLEQKEYASGGITISSPKIIFPIPALVPLNRSGIVDIGPYIQAGLNISVQGGVQRKKYIETSVFQNDENYLMLIASGCITAGVTAELLVAKDQVDFSVNFNGVGCLAGSGKYNFTSKLLTAEFYIPPVVLTGEIKIKTKGVLKFELIDWSKKITVTEKIPLGSPLKHQF